MELILDSSIVIAAERRGHTIRQILEQIQSKHGDIDIALSVVTIAELMHGVYRAKTEADKQRRMAFVERLASDIPVHAMTIEIARMVGRIEGQQAAQGIVIGFEDLVIGVTALQLGFDIATLNIRHSSISPASRSSPSKSDSPDIYLRPNRTHTCFGSRSSSRFQFF